MLIILFFYLPRNSSSFAMSKENNRLPTVLLDMLIQSPRNKIPKPCHSEQSEESRRQPRGCSRDPSLHFVPFWMTRRVKSKIFINPLKHKNYERNDDFQKCRIRCHPHHE